MVSPKIPDPPSGATLTFLRTLRKSAFDSWWFSGPKLGGPGAGLRGHRQHQKAGERTQNLPLQPLKGTHLACSILVYLKHTFACI